MANPIDPDTRLRREQGAAALTANGLPTSKATLSTLASRGGGPPFQKFGRYPIYTWRDLLAWAEARLSPPVTSTAELDAARPPDHALSPLPPPQQVGMGHNGGPPMADIEGPPIQPNAGSSPAASTSRRRRDRPRARPADDLDRPSVA